MKIGVQEQLDKISRNFCSVKYVFCIKPSSQETKTEVKGVNRELVRGDFLPFLAFFALHLFLQRKVALVGLNGIEFTTKEKSKQTFGRMYVVCHNCIMQDTHCKIRAT